MSKLFRFDVLVDDPDPVFDWLANQAPGHVLRHVAYDTFLGWSVKVVLTDPDTADAFRRRWSDDLGENQIAVRRNRLFYRRAAAG